MDEFTFPSDLSALTAAELDEILLKNDINYLNMTDGLKLTTDESGYTWIIATDSDGGESWDLWESANDSE